MLYWELAVVEEVYSDVDYNQASKDLDDLDDI